VRLLGLTAAMGDDGSTMTDLLNCTEVRSLPATHSRPPAWLAGAGAGAVAAASGVVAGMGLAVVAWLSSGPGSMAGALRAGALGWLLGHGSGITAGKATVTAVPLGVTLLGAALAWAAGRWAATVSGVASWRGAATVAATVAMGYCACVATVALLATAPQASVSTMRAVAVSAVLTGAVAALAAARVARLDRAAVGWLPDDLRAALLGAAAGLAALLGAAALTLAAALVGQVSVLDRMLGSLGLGWVGALLLLMACILVLPNAVLLTLSVLLGPGFVLGTGTQVTLTSVELGAVPAVPWFAAVPSPGQHPLWAMGLAAVPLLSGVVAGFLAAGAGPVTGYRQAGLRGGLAGVVTAITVVGLLGASGGSIGPGRMADVGPVMLGCLLVAVPVLGVGGLLGGAAARFAKIGR